MSKDILKKVRQIEIRTKNLVNDFFGGDYHSNFKGRGMIFSEVREYQPGDDVRFIDWNVSDIVGTGSLRRRAQWMRKFPKHKTENLRGNIQTRLKKLNKSKWGGAIFAKVGLERLDLLNKNKV